MTTNINQYDAIIILALALFGIVACMIIYALFTRKQYCKEMCEGLREVTGGAYDVIKTNAKLIVELKYQVNRAEKDLEASNEIVNAHVQTIQDYEKLLKCKDSELTEMEERLAKPADDLMPRTHRELLCQEIRDHKNTKLLLDLATKANKEYAEEVERLTELARKLARTEIGDELDREIQEMEDLRDQYQVEIHKPEQANLGGDSVAPAVMVEGNDPDLAG